LYPQILSCNLIFLSAETKKKLDFLEANVEPWDKVVSFWKDTAECRTKALQSAIEEGAVAQYFGNYPALKEKEGFALVTAFSFSLLPRG